MVRAPRWFVVSAAVMLLVGPAAGRTLAGNVPKPLVDRAAQEGTVRVLVQLRVNTLPEGQRGGPEQPAPAPGPGPISPGSGPQTPPEVLPRPEKATEVPIGRLEGYEEEKRKALEFPFGGRPPGTLQEDPALHRRRPETGSCDGR
jgi:hypothetical protein